MAEVLSNNKPRKSIDALWVRKPKKGERCVLLNTNNETIQTSPVVDVLITRNTPPESYLLIETERTLYDISVREIIA